MGCRGEKKNNHLEEREEPADRIDTRESSSLQKFPPFSVGYLADTLDRGANFHAQAFYFPFHRFLLLLLMLLGSFQMGGGGQKQIDLPRQEYKCKRNSG